MLRRGFKPTGAVHYGLAAFALLAFAVYFDWDIVTLRRTMLHADYFTYYFPFRQWFAGQLAQGEFPLWNPYWGIGHSAEVWASIPLDIYTIFEVLGFHAYHYYFLAQLVFLLLATGFVFVKLRFNPYLAAAASILSFLSPLTLHFYFYFLLGDNFIALPLLTWALWRWWRSGARTYLFLTYVVFTLSMLGTKLEFWFFQACYAAFVVVTLALMDRRALPAKLWRIALPGLAIVLAVLTNAWQLVILLPIMGQSGRVASVSPFAALFHAEIYFRFIQSIVLSGLWQLSAGALLIYVVAASIATRLQRSSSAMRHGAAIMGLGLAVFAGYRFVSSLPYHELTAADAAGGKSSYVFALVRNGTCNLPDSRGDSRIFLPRVSEGSCSISAPIGSIDSLRGRLVRITFNADQFKPDNAVVFELSDGIDPPTILTPTLPAEFEMTPPAAPQQLTLERFVAKSSPALILTASVFAVDGQGVRDSSPGAAAQIRDLDVAFRKPVLPARLYVGGWPEALGNLVPQRARSLTTRWPAGIEILGRASMSPVSLGLVIALVASVLCFGLGRWRILLRQFLLTTPLVYYLCRPPPGDLGESAIMALAPSTWFAMVAFLGALGCRSVGRYRLATLAYASIVFVELMREQGQVLLAHLLGLLWLTSRDTYLIDFNLALLCLFGLRSLSRAATAGLRSLSQKSWMSGKYVEASLALGALMLAVLPISHDLYYSNSLMRKPPPGFPYDHGIPALLQIFDRIKAQDPMARVYLVNYEARTFTYGFPEALFTAVDQVTLYSSLNEQRYKDWMIFQNLGVRPEENWDGYSDGYSASTLSLLPRKNDLGRNPSVHYFYTVISRPPLRGDALRLLGVDYVLILHPVTGRELTTPARLSEIENAVAALRPVSTVPVTGFASPMVDAPHSIARLGGALPRAYAFSGLVKEEREALEHDIDPRIVASDALEFGGKQHKFAPVRLLTYEPKQVTLEAHLDADGEVVLADLFHPFWQAQIDGKPVPISPAFRLFRAVSVPAGDHRIDFVCRVPGLGASLVVSILAVVGALIGGLANTTRRRSRDAA